MARQRAAQRCRRGVASAGGRRFPGQRGIFFEDRGLEIANHRRRLQAELFAQSVPVLVRGAQRFGLPARPVQREHQLAAEALAQRMVHKQRFELSHDLIVVADRQLGFDLRLGRDDPQLVEPDRFWADPLGVGELDERGTAPLGQRRLERVQRRVGIGFEEGVPVGELALETSGVNEVLRHFEHVTGRAVAQRRVLLTELDEAAQARDVALERGTGRVGRVDPERVDEAVG